MGSIVGSYKLCRNAQSLAVLAHRALEHMCRAQSLANGADVVAGTFELESGTTRNNAKIRDLRERRGDLFRYPLREEVLARIGRHVDEWKDRNRDRTWRNPRRRLDRKSVV